MGIRSLSLNSGFVFNGSVRRVKEGGRNWLVAPLTLINPGVLAGSQGPLMYTPEQTAKASPSWNRIPLVLYHPTHNGRHVSAKHPGILEASGLGEVRKPNFNGKLRAEGWFDEQRVKRIAPEVHDALVNGIPIELSTGLFTSNVPAPAGSSHLGKSFTHFAEDHQPDHLAILPDQVGACSVRDGCGVLVNQASETWLDVNSNPEGCNQFKACGGGGGHSETASKASAKAEAASKRASTVSGGYLHKKAAEAHREASVAHRRAALKTAGTSKALEHHEKASKHLQTSAEHSILANNSKTMVTNSSTKSGAYQQLFDEGWTELVLAQNREGSWTLVENCGGPGSGVPGPCPSGGSTSKLGLTSLREMWAGGVKAMSYEKVDAAVGDLSKLKGQALHSEVKGIFGESHGGAIIKSGKTKEGIIKKVRQNFVDRLGMETRVHNAWTEIENVFCSTGEGGGVKPDCKAGGGGGASGGAVGQSKAADKASVEAEKLGTESAHRKASTEHWKASKAHEEAGNKKDAKWHNDKSRYHAEKATFANNSSRLPGGWTEVGNEEGCHCGGTCESCKKEPKIEAVKPTASRSPGKLFGTADGWQPAETYQI